MAAGTAGDAGSKRLSGLSVLAFQNAREANCGKASNASPIVAAELDALGVQVNITLHDKTFFMKPLVRELAAALRKDHKR